MSIKELYNALNTPVDYKKALELLQSGVNPNLYLEEEATWGILGDAFYSYDNTEISRKLIHYLLKHDVEVNPPIITDETPLHAIIKYMSSNVLYYNEFIETLLEKGANPNIVTGMPFNANILVDTNKSLNISKLLLDYGALYNKAIPKGFVNTNALHNASRTGNLKMVKLLLDYGADVMSTEESYMIDYDNCKDMVFDDIKLTDKECEELKTLLNPNNPPYLKLGENDEDKYIIYENELIEPKPYLLVDKQKYNDKKYLYEDNKIDAFVYWCYKNELLNESTLKVLDRYLFQVEVSQYNKLSDMLKQTLGEKLTTEYFNEAGKDFAISYLTVTHWWYSLHYDFNKLYQDKENKLPRTINSQEEFDMLMKLLDIRYKQFTSGKDFNSNQNKDELEALIEGKEARKRVVDLSCFLENKE